MPAIAYSQVNNWEIGIFEKLQVSCEDISHLKQHSLNEYINTVYCIGISKVTAALCVVDSKGEFDYPFQVDSSFLHWLEQYNHQFKLKCVEIPLTCLDQI